jgi:Domain of unknown function (DUF4326)
MSSTVVNVKVNSIRPAYKNLKEWMEDTNNVYIGRRGVVFVDKVRWPPQDSTFCNPFKMDASAEDQVGERKRVIGLYKQHLEEMLKRNPELIEVLRTMKGKKLGCWCSPEPCHGDILAEYINSL